MNKRFRTDYIPGVTGHADLHNEIGAALNSLLQRPVSPRDFGAIGDGVADDTAALQAAIDSLYVPAGIGGGVIDLSDGEWLVSDTLTVTRQSVQIVGSGWGNGKTYTHPSRGTSLRWKAGSGHKPMLRFRDCIGVVVEGIRFLGANSDAPDDTPSAAINFHWQTGDNKGSNARLIVSRCWIGAFAWVPEAKRDHGFECGVLFDGANGNNDEWVIRDCIITDCSDAGVRLVNTQSVWGRIADTMIGGCATGIDTNADLSATNIQFDTCALDWRIRDGSSVWCAGYFAENSQQFAWLDYAARFIVSGGDINVNAITADYMIDCPLSWSAFVSLSHLDFDLGTTTARIRLASDGQQENTEGTIVIQDCRGLTLANLDIVPSVGGYTNFLRWADRATVIARALNTGDTL